MTESEDCKHENIIGRCSGCGEKFETGLCLKTTTTSNTAASFEAPEETVLERQLKRKVKFLEQQVQLLQKELDSRDSDKPEDTESKMWQRLRQEAQNQLFGTRDHLERMVRSELAGSEQRMRAIEHQAERDRRAVDAVSVLEPRMNNIDSRIAELFALLKDVQAKLDTVSPPK